MEGASGHLNIERKRAEIIAQAWNIGRHTACCNSPDGGRATWLAGLVDWLIGCEAEDRVFVGWYIWNVIGGMIFLKYRIWWL